MKKWLMLLLLLACAPVIEPQSVQEPVVMPVVELPVVGKAFQLYTLMDNYLIRKTIEPYWYISSDALYDTFGIVPAEHYQALYQSGINVLVRVFKFSSKNEVDYLINTELRDFFEKGGFEHQGSKIAMYLSVDEERISMWPSYDKFIFIESSDQRYVAKEILDAYIAKYPSDYETNKCVDSDGQYYFEKGTVNRMVVQNKLTKWDDVCIQDYELFKTGDYKSVKGMREGLLEGVCGKDGFGKIQEYPCPRECVDGKCVI